MGARPDPDQQGKTQLWNPGGTLPPRCEHIIEAGRRAHPPVTVWRGDLPLPAEEQGIRVLGTPSGHREFVEAEVLRTNEEHTALLDRIEAVPDLQCAWLILLFCAAARANCLLRVVHPSWSEAFTVRHDAAVWKCLCGLLDIRGTEEMRDRASLSLSSGGLGLRSATRGRDCAFWASWADALPTIRKRHPAVADQICVALQRGDVGLHLVEAAQCRERLNTSGFESPEWGDVARGLQPGQISLDDPMPGVARQGWQRGAAQHVEERFRTDIVWPRLDPPGQALLRSQSGPMAGIPFCCFPISMVTRFEPQEFRILLLRRLWCPLPLCSASCRCGRPLNPRGHHRAACQVAGVLGRRGFPIESAVARVCREAGGRASHRVRPRTTVVWRWSWTDCHCFTVHSSQWMRRWCPQCAETEQLADNAPRQMVQP